MKLKVYLSYNEYQNIRYYKMFGVADALPKDVEFIEKLRTDQEQRSDCIYNYDCYKVIASESTVLYFAIKK